MARQWDSCVNKHIVGEWREVQQRLLDQRGVSAHQAIRHQLSDKIADKLLTRMCEVVAVFTQHCQHRFWLAKPISKPWVVAEGAEFECPSSGETFGPGERVLTVHYYDRLDRSADIFKLREDLGVFCIPTSMLRVGDEQPIQLSARAASERPHRHARDSGVSASVSALLALCADSKKHILDMIENVYKDPS